MATSHGWIHPEVYREARRKGWKPWHAAMVARPARVELDSDPNAMSWDAGTFEYQGETFTYRMEWDDDCLCREPDTEMSAEDYEHSDHLILTVELGEDSESLGSVCTMRGDWVEDRAAACYRADTLAELADEVLATRASRTAGLWA